MFSKRTGCLRLAGIYLYIIISAVLLTFAPAISAQKLTFVSGQPASRLQFQVQRLDNQVGNLLLNIPMGTGSATSPAEVEETYRLVIRHLYQSAIQCKNRNLRSMIVLKADQLYAGLSDFDQQAVVLLSPANSNYAAIVQGCRDFYRASVHVNMAITSVGTLNNYLHKLLKPLAPMAQMEFTGASAPMVWPVPPASQTQWRGRASATALPDIGAEIHALRHATISPEMRSVVRSILQELQHGIKNSGTRRQSLMYYQVILRCVNLAEDLQQGKVLSPHARSQFSHRLMLGLLFFKDPRTRSSAARKLEFISTVVGSLELLQTAPLPVKAQSVVSQCVHNTIMQLQIDNNTSRYTDDLQALDQLLIRQSVLAQILQHDHAAYTNLAWRQITDDGNKDLQGVIKALKHGVSRGAIQTYIHRVTELSQNINRLVAMRSSAQQALLYHPEPADGIKRNMHRWARHIGMHPYETGNAAKSFDRFNQVLEILAATHREMAAQGPHKLLVRLSGGRYQRFVTVFLQTQRDLVNALAHPQLVSEALVRRLNRQRLIFKTSSELAYLLKKHNPMLRLNQWAAWHINLPAQKTLLNQFEQTMSFEFHLATSRKPMSSEAWAGFSAVAAPITTLADACQMLLPELNAPLTAWSTGWLQAYSQQPANTIYHNELFSFSQACMFFNSAEYQNTRGNSQAAIKLFNSGLNAIRGK